MMEVVPTWKPKVRRYLRKKAREDEKRMRGWRGLVFNRASFGLALLFIAWLFEEPWAAVWIGSVIVAGIL